MGRESPEVLYDRGVALYGEGLLEDAEQAYRRCVELEPEAEPAWFNLGLIYKRWHRWPDSLDCFRRSLELDPNERSAAWNMGIAATAIGDWETARFAWKAYGIDIPDGSGPPDLDYGPTPVRLDPDG